MRKLTFLITIILLTGITYGVTEVPEAKNAQSATIKEAKAVEAAKESAAQPAKAVDVAEKPATPPAQSGELTVDQIVDKANIAAYYLGNNGRAKTKMVITDAQGRTRERQFTMLRMDKEDGGEQKFYVYFDRPADVSRMVYLVWKKPQDDDDRWLYLPSLDLVKRIAAGDKRTSFAGSDFFYEDVSGRSPELDNHTLLDSSGQFYVLDNTPKNLDSVEFSHYKMYIHKETFLPLKIIFYDKNGEEHRIIEALNVKPVQGFPTVLQSRVTDKKSGGNTVNTIYDVQYDIDGIEDDVFTERYLRRKPKEIRY